MEDAYNHNSKYKTSDRKLAQKVLDAWKKTISQDQHTLRKQGSQGHQHNRIGSMGGSGYAYPSLINTNTPHRYSEEIHENDSHETSFNHASHADDE